MGATFKRALRHRLNIRLALCGPTGSGKTYTALGVAVTLAEGGTVAVIDTERSSSDRYADRFAFDACQLETFSPESYMEAIENAASSGYRVLVIDSLSHAWDGAEGLLERVDNIAARQHRGNTFSAWSEGNPLQRRLVDAILSYPGHVIVTMRSKMEYVQEKDERGKTSIRKVGLQPVQRAGIEYEFDLCADMDCEHNMVISKSRCADLADKVISKPGKSFALQLLKWANGDGIEITQAPDKQDAQNASATQPTAPAESSPAKHVATQAQVNSGAVKKDVVIGKGIADDAKRIMSLVMQVRGVSSRGDVCAELSRLLSRAITGSSDLSDDNERKQLLAWLETVAADNNSEHRARMWDRTALAYAQKAKGA